MINDELLRKHRARLMNDKPELPGAVMYLSINSFREEDNPALDLTIVLANLSKSPAFVLCALDSEISASAAEFVKSSLGGRAESLKRLNIPFTTINEYDPATCARMAESAGGGIIVSDFVTTKPRRRFVEDIAKQFPGAFIECDARNSVPLWETSLKQEFSARTIRPKIQSLLSEYLDAPSAPKRVEASFEGSILQNLVPDFRPGFTSGEAQARETLERFIDLKLDEYAANKNNPGLDACSRLSKYLAYGMISPLKAVRAALNSGARRESIDSFVEEITVRRDLSDNFCYYNPNYDSFKGFPEWAQRTLNDRREDKRDYLYSLDAFENADTHDDYWNTAQKELLTTGVIHGYARMYWAKKMLDWSRDPETALDVAIYLNDKYALDGLDSNGYAGIAWSIGGVHDRPWFSRPVFGSVRYMSYQSQIKKFSLDAYKRRIECM